MIDAAEFPGKNNPGGSDRPDPSVGAAARPSVGRPRTRTADSRAALRSRSFPYELLGAKLREQRVRQHLTMEKLRDLCGVSVSQISDIESGNKITFETAHRMSKALHIRLSTLIRRAEDAAALERPAAD